LKQKGVTEIIGSEKRVLSAAAKVDFFDTSNGVSLKEKRVEKYFLYLIYHGKILPGGVFSETELS
jgi:hypothetical protein